MSLVKIQGNASGTGTLTIAAPNTNSDYTLTLPASSGTVATLATVTNNGVVYVNSSGQPTSGSALAFDGTNLGIGITSPSYKLQVVSGSTAPAARFQYTGTASFQPTVTLRNTADGNGYISQLDLLGQNAAGTDQISFIASQTNTSGYEPNLIFGMRVGGSTYTERARIDSSGNLLVGTTSSEGPSRLSVLQFNANQSCIGLRHTNGSGEKFISFINSGNSAIIGSISNSGNTATAYNTSSDYRLKEDIQPMAGALAKVAALKPVTYTWKSTGETDQGFIAHELAEVCPSAVTGEKDAVNEDGSIKPQGIDTSFLVATLTAAIQELKAIVDAQGAEIAALKGTA